MTDSTAVPLFPDVSEHLGKYRILRQLAQGGMAEIFLATASGIEGFEKLCVIKRALPILANRPETVQMFLDEARIAASLQHANITQVFDIGVDRGRHYFVMEFLRGEDLHRVFKTALKHKQPIAFDHMVTIISSVCAALQYAHELRGKDNKPLEMVHRDVSPQNIFVTYDGSVKLCDFGIAESNTARVTETQGTIRGKVRYMSPEQCQGEPLDRRTDLFSLAIVMWEMVTQRQLYTRKSDLETFMAICDDTPPLPSWLRKDVPAGLDAIIMKGLSKRRADRYQTAHELQSALEDWARTQRMPASPLRLASFMNELFGAPASNVHDFLEQITEDDGLVTRIRTLNHHRESIDAVPAAVAAVDETRDLPSASSPETVDAITPSKPLSQAHVAPPFSRPAPRVLTLLALVALAAALGVLAGHRRRAAEGIEVQSASSTPTIVPAPVVPPTPKPTVVVAAPPPTAAVRPHPAAMRSTSSPTTSAARSGKRSKKPPTVKSTRVVDGLYPP